MQPRGVLMLLVWLVIFCLVAWLAWWVIAWLGLPDPIGKIIFVLICLLLLIGFLDRSGIYSFTVPPK